MTLGFEHHLISPGRFFSALLLISCDNCCLTLIWNMFSTEPFRKWQIDFGDEISSISNVRIEFQFSNGVNLISIYILISAEHFTNDISTVHLYVTCTTHQHHPNKFIILTNLKCQLICTIWGRKILFCFRNE